MSRAQRGWLQDLTVRALRSVFGALDAGVQVAPRWRGAELDRLIDEDHSVVVHEVVRRLERLGWSTEVEVTYSEFGERGSIDVLGLRADVGAAAVVEAKTDLMSSEAVGRKLDEKARLAPSMSPGGTAGHRRVSVGSWSCPGPCGSGGSWRVIR